MVRGETGIRGKQVKARMLIAEYTHLKLQYEYPMTTLALIQ